MEDLESKTRCHEIGLHHQSLRLRELPVLRCIQYDLVYMATFLAVTHTYLQHFLGQPGISTMR